MNEELGVLTGRRAVAGHDDALSRREPVRFHDIWGTKFDECRFDLDHRRRRNRTSRGDTGRIHDLFREFLRALDLRGRLVRTEHGDTDRTKCVGNTRDERRFGADDDQLDTLFRGVGGDERTVRRVERYRLYHSGNPGVPRGHHNLVSGRVTQQCVDDGVLSGTRPNHEYLHVKTLPSPLLACWACPFPESISI